jgi:anaphase-promoting complex subunit 5
MARYLTPAKISLLVLIELYCFEPMPDAAILPVLMFVVSHVTDVDPTTTPGSAVARDARWDRAGKTMDLIVDVGEFEELLAPHAVVAGGTGSSTPYTTLWDLFLFRLWRISSLDCLHVFFGRLSMVMAPLAPGADGGDDHVEGDAYGGAGDDDDDEDDDYNVDDSENERPRVILSRTSPFGMFVRRAQLEFHRLRFHDMAELWRGLVRYRQPTMAYVRQRSTAAAARNKFAFDHVLVSFEHDLGGDGDLAGGLASIVYGDMLEHGADAPRLISTDDVEALLEFQIEQVQRESRDVGKKGVDTL